MFKMKLHLNLSSLVIYLGISSALVNPALAFAPIFVGGMVTVLGLSTKSAVIILAAELVASALSFLLALWWVSKIPWRKVALISLFATSLGNFLSINCDSFYTLLMVRFFTGLFEGNLLIIYMLVAAQITKTEQLFGGKLALQMLTVVVGLALLPRIVSVYGLSGIYVVLTVLTGALALGVRLLPNIDTSQRSLFAQNKQINPSLWGSLSLLLLLLFAAGTNVVWTYLERIGTANSLALDQIGLILACAILLSITCGLICSSIGIRFGRLLPIVFGLSAGIAGCFFLRIEDVTLIYFLIGVFLIAAAKVLPLPYLFGCLAKLDHNKQLAVFSHVVLALGMALGPLLTVMLSHDVGYKNVLVLSVVILSLTLLLSIKLVQVVRQVEGAQK